MTDRRPANTPDGTAAGASAPPRDLLAAARDVHANAYVPYSSFRVGAALRADDGTIHAGANIENASYGLGRCAEQSAIQAMASSGARAFTELVVVSDADPPASPCGACRQVLFEFSPEATVWMVGPNGSARATTVRELLPDAFELPRDAS